MIWNHQIIKTIIKYKLNFILIVQTCRQITDCVAVRTDDGGVEIAAVPPPRRLFWAQLPLAVAQIPSWAVEQMGQKSVEEKIA